jgi:hypothetical protein
MKRRLEGFGSRESWGLDVRGAELELEYEYEYEYEYD